MRKVLFSLIAVAAAATMFDTAANAQYRRDQGPDTKFGTACPAHTCGPRGGPRAPSVDLCKPTNCKK
jgi:hypothetical protein